MGKYKEIQIEVSDEVYAALEQLADDLNKAETIILNRTGKQSKHMFTISRKENARNRIRWDIQSRREKNARACNHSKNDRRTGGTS